MKKRDYTRQELKNKLREKGFLEEEIEPWLQRLEKRGYLDDRRLITHLIIKKMEEQPQSREFLRLFLHNKGFGADLINDMLNEYYPASEEKKIALDWLHRQKANDERELLKKLAYLARRGFGWELLEELRENWPGLDSNRKKR